MTSPAWIHQLPRAFAAALGVLTFAACSSVAQMPAADPTGSGALRFASPEKAVEALVAASKTGNRVAVDALFGPDIKDLLSGDPRQDDIEFARFAKSIGKFAHLNKQSEDRYVLNIGDQNWPMPIPLVRRDGSWFFDAEAGKGEILSRRIGQDELTAIGVCKTYVLAQREYASEDRDGTGILKFAQRLKSTPDHKDGLYWPVGPGEEQSPFGPLVAEARTEGYGPNGDGKPQPFHGYRFKILTAQGAAAPGGAFNYVINGNMIAGFALVAYPAHWGESGVMTFIVNQWGKVYQRNLGAQSAETAQAMTEFDPDSDWEVVP